MIKIITRSDNTVTILKSQITPVDKIFYVNFLKL